MLREGQRVDVHLNRLGMAAARITDAQRQRDDAIREAYRVGMPVAMIAEAVGLTRGRIYHLLNPTPEPPR